MPKVTVASNAANEGLVDRLVAAAVTRLKRIARVFLPGGTRRRHAVMRLVDRGEGAENAAFGRWIRTVEPKIGRAHV